MFLGENITNFIFFWFKIFIYVSLKNIPFYFLEDKKVPFQIQWSKISCFRFVWQKQTQAIVGWPKHFSLFINTIHVIQSTPSVPNYKSF
jgi:hypothetical protein